MLGRSGVRDHRAVGYRVSKEWAVLTEVHRETGSLAAFKRVSRAGFLAGYGSFVWGVAVGWCFDISETVGCCFDISENYAGR